MSRTLKTDHEFNHNQVLQLLKKAQGQTRTQLAFAQAIGMNYAYLCRYMKGTVNRPLSPDMLKKIAAAAEGSVTLEELLDASGFDPEKYVSPYLIEYQNEDLFLENSKFEQFHAYMEASYPRDFSAAGYRPNRARAEIQIKKFREHAVEAVYDYVCKNLTDYNVLFVDKSIPADLVLSVFAPESTTWSFNYFYSTDGESPSSIRIRVKRLVSTLSVSSVSPKGYYFIVTDSEECFDHLGQLTFPLIYQRITVLHFDAERLKIDNTKVLETAVPR